VPSRANTHPRRIEKPGAFRAHRQPQCRAHQEQRRAYPAQKPEPSGLGPEDAVLAQLVEQQAGVMQARSDIASASRRAGAAR